MTFPCVEFIHLISSEASEISDREQRKTILPEHIIEALTVCTLSHYVPHYILLNHVYLSVHGGQVLFICF